jgi:hypothetical protein
LSILVGGSSDRRLHFVLSDVEPSSVKVLVTASYRWPNTGVLATGLHSSHSNTQVFTYSYGFIINAKRGFRQLHKQMTVCLPEITFHKTALLKILDDVYC